MERRLQRAEKHARAGDLIVARQRVLLERLEQEGHRTDTARTLLEQFEGLQELNDRDWLQLALRLIALKITLGRLH